jgi:hypothetical protein
MMCTSSGLAASLVRWRRMLSAPCAANCAGDSKKTLASVVAKSWKPELLRPVRLEETMEWPKR